MLRASANLVLRKKDDTTPIPCAVCKDSESEIRIDYPVRLCCVFTITSQALVVAGLSGWSRLERDLQAGKISWLKWRDTHVQLTKWFGNDENKHDKVTFQLAADFDSVHLWSRYLCDRHRILKENSWMCILHQHHKASGLKSYTRCVGSGVNIRYISLIQDGGAQVHHIFFSWRSCCCEIIW